MKEPSLVTHSKDEINVSCTWGDGPDVCVNIKYDPKQTRQNFNLNGFFPLDFTGDEAIRMGYLLIQAGQQAKRMDDSYRQYCEDHKDEI